MTDLENGLQDIQNIHELLVLYRWLKNMLTNFMYPYVEVYWYIFHCYKQGERTLEKKNRHISINDYPKVTDMSSLCVSGFGSKDTGNLVI